METRSGTCPLTRKELADEYFLENRARLLDLAAFLDRLDRAAPGGPERDFRLEAFRAALEELRSPVPGRVKRIQLLFSDPTTEPVERLAGKGAVGAYDRSRLEAR